MARRTAAFEQTLKKLSDGHGNAGLASNFMDLAHRKASRGRHSCAGPALHLTQGASWANARALIKKYYDDILLVSIASDGGDDRAFSADTGMAEVLLLAKRKESEDKGTGDIVVVNLLRRPRTQVEAVAMARTRGTVPAEQKGRCWGRSGDRDTRSRQLFSFRRMGRRRGDAGRFGDLHAVARARHPAVAADARCGANTGMQTGEAGP